MAARYRKIDPRLWWDEIFRLLSMIEKLIAVYVLTAQSNRIGLFLFSPARAAEDLEMPIETFLKGFEKVCKAFGWGWDKPSRVVFVPTWFKYNLPENPNVLKACLSDLHDLPETHLLSKFSDNLTYLPETFHETFRKGLGVPSTEPSHKPMANQEQDQEPEKEQEKNGHPLLSVASDYIEDATRVLQCLNEGSGHHYQLRSARGKLTTNAEFIIDRLKGGASVEQCLAVIAAKCREWRDDPKMCRHLSPDTLFNRTKLDKYVGQLRSTNGDRAPQCVGCHVDEDGRRSRCKELPVPGEKLCKEHMTRAKLVETNGRLEKVNA